MKAKDYPQFIKYFKLLTEIYNQKNPSDELIALWWQALEPYDINAISKAFSIHIQRPDDEVKFMPKPGQIIAILGGSTTDKAMLAWTKLENAVRLVGSWSSIVFDDPLIHRVIADMGGWITLCSRNDKEWPFIRNEFVTRYRGSSINPSSSPYPPVLVGQFELTNQRDGYPVTAPCLFGDVEKARLVMAGRLNTVPSRQSKDASVDYENLAPDTGTPDLCRATSTGSCLAGH